MEIYCVKVKQVAIPIKKSTAYPNYGGYTSYDYYYMPFDRMYLVRGEDLGVTKKLFRYCLIVPLTPELYRLFDNMDVDLSREITPHRDDKAISKNPDKDIAKSLVERFKPTKEEPWYIVVPTRAKMNYSGASAKGDLNPKMKTVAEDSTLAYVVSKVLECRQGGTYNKNMKPPSIVLQTPKKTFPLLCASCLNISDFYANACSPLHESCSKKAKIIVDLDTYFSGYQKKTKKKNNTAKG